MDFKNNPCLGLRSITLLMSLNPISASTTLTAKRNPSLGSKAVRRWTRLVASGAITYGPGFQCYFPANKAKTISGSAPSHDAPHPPLRPCGAIRGVPKEFSLDVKTDLLAQKIPVRAVRRVTNRNREPLDFVLVSAEPSTKDNVKAILFNIKTVCSLSGIKSPRKPQTFYRPLVWSGL
ncbi:hypothetical protein EVAR_18571_1 [Eumeta japonica]|uniref:Pre-C2HC domain-containing protein n=1 Tax=Eumeta variegata TaxID=151549 RepID=A0A4C1V494_EUMVA|nr:hypothetical protein EVAR_18571_1 [Eumeta japonica]